MNEKELREEEFSRLWASVSPLVEKMKAKYPKELNLNGLEPALIHDICMIVKERDERLKEKIRNFPWTHNRAGETSMYVKDIINLIDNHD